MYTNEKREREKKQNLITECYVSAEIMAINRKD